MAKKINTLCYEIHTNLDLDGYEDTDEVENQQELNYHM